MQTRAPVDDIAAIQAELSARGITVEVDGIELRCKGPAGTLTPELREAVRSHKRDLLLALTGFAPLDRAIITSTASHMSIEQIHERLAHARQMAARPDATPLHRQLVADWRAILRERERRDTLAHAGAGQEVA